MGGDGKILLLNVTKTLDTVILGDRFGDRSKIIWHTLYQKWQIQHLLVYHPYTLTKDDVKELSKCVLPCPQKYTFNSHGPFSIGSVGRMEIKCSVL